MMPSAWTPRSWRAALRGQDGLGRVSKITAPTRKSCEMQEPCGTNGVVATKHEWRGVNQVTNGVVSPRVWCHKRCGVNQVARRACGGLRCRDEGT